MQSTMYRLDIWGSSDPGKVRRSNQDALFFVASEQDGISAEMLAENGHLLAVADGVGGVAGGAEASRQIIDSLVTCFYQPHTTSIGDHLEQSIIKANQIARSAVANREASTTLVVAVIHHSALYVAHVGDSRAYLLRNRQLQQLTRDHAFGSTLMRYLVATDIVEVEMQDEIELEVNDQLLLCSDGFYRAIEKPSEVVDILRQFSAEEAAYQLVDLANAKGGDDNISVVLCQVRSNNKQKQGFTSRWESI